jgi:hypothetical protein
MIYEIVGRLSGKIGSASGSELGPVSAKGRADAALQLFPGAAFPAQPRASSPRASARPALRSFALAVMVAAQFIYVLDAFIVNVAVPAIRADLQASSAEVEAVIAVSFSLDSAVTGW